MPTSFIRIAGTYSKTTTLFTPQTTVDFVDPNLFTIDWPSYGSNLSPIENLWPILKRNVRKRLPQTLDELEDYIYEEWDLLEDDMIRNLCNSIRTRIGLCIQQRGSHIKYELYIIKTYCNTSLFAKNSKTNFCPNFFFSDCRMKLISGFFQDKMNYYIFRHI